MKFQSLNQMKLGAIQGPDWLDIKSPAYFDQDQGQPNLACLMNKKGALSKSWSADQRRRIYFLRRSRISVRRTISVAGLGGWCGSFFFWHHGHKLVCWLDDDEKDNGGSNHKTDYGMNDHAYIDHFWQLFAFFIDEFTNFDAKGHIRIGSMIALVKAVTIVPKAAPMMTPVERSTTLPLRMNF
jgi:hypothetical protein